MEGEEISLAGGPQLRQAKPADIRPSQKSLQIFLASDEAEGDKPHQRQVANGTAVAGDSHKKDEPQPILSPVTPGSSGRCFGEADSSDEEEETEGPMEGDDCSQNFSSAEEGNGTTEGKLEETAEEKNSEGEDPRNLSTEWQNKKSTQDNASERQYRASLTAPEQSAILEPTDEEIDDSAILNNLHAWEIARRQRQLEFDALLTPLIADVVTTLAGAIEANASFDRFLRSRARFCRDCSEALTDAQPRRRRQHSAEGSISETPSSGSTFKVTKISGTPLLDLSRAQQLAVTPWLRIFNSNESRESSLYKRAAEEISIGMLKGSAQRDLREFTDTSMQIIIDLQDNFAKISSRTKVVERCWNELNKVIVGGGSSPRPATKAKKSDLQEGVSVPPKDRWLSERNYIAAVMLSHQQQLTFIQQLRRSISDTVEFDLWRVKALREISSLFLQSMRTLSAQLMAGVCGVHSVVDPEDYVSTSRRSVTVAEGEEEQTQTQHARTQILLQVENELEGEGFEAIASHRIAPSKFAWFGLEAATAPEQVPQVRQATEMLEAVSVPQARLCIKKGMVKRHAGSLLAKWSDGLLVLTWDRWLHMFKTLKDATPAWSVFVPSVEVRNGSRKTPNSIELRDRKGLFGSLGVKSVLFRSLNAMEFESWLRVLALASEVASPLEFRRGAIAEAVRAEAQAVSDYAAWMNRQRTVPAHILADLGHERIGEDEIRDLNESDG